MSQLHPMAQGAFAFNFRYFKVGPSVLPNDPYIVTIRADSEFDAHSKFTKHVPNVNRGKLIDVEQQ